MTSSKKSTPKKPATPGNAYFNLNQIVKKVEDDGADEVFTSKKGQNGVDDMVMLPKIDEGSLVDNLKKRYDADAIYTNIGPVLLSVNPYKDLGVWGQDYILLYQGKQRHENPPHIYALAEETYRMMRSERENQCCIAAGTPVLLADGTALPIEQLPARVRALGALDVVGTFVSPAGGAPQSRAAQCNAAWLVGQKECVELAFQDGRRLVCTPDHRVMSADGKWIEAQQLVVGETRVAVSSAPRGAALERNAAPLPTLSQLVVARRDVGVRAVYDISVPACQSFMANGVVVHNCIISGESGAGKTVAAKHIMAYVAAVSGKDPKIEYVKSVILDSNPVLEAFGNAKTLRNDNSSRFGKYFEIQFDCVAGDTLVAMGDGTARTIESLHALSGKHSVVGPLIGGTDAVAATPATTMRRGTRDDCVQLTLLDGRALTVTADHRVMLHNVADTLDGDDVGFVQAGHLAVLAECAPMQFELASAGPFGEQYGIAAGCVATSATVAVEDVPEPASESRFARTYASIDVDMATTQSRARALAFARLLGASTARCATHPSAKAWNELVGEVELDAEALLRDARLVEPHGPQMQALPPTADGKLAPVPRVVVGERLGAALRAALGDAARVDANSPVALAAAVEGAPRAFVREYVAALLGRLAKAPTVDRKVGGFFNLSWDRLDECMKRGIAALLKSLGAADDHLGRGDRGLTASGSLWFTPSVGVRYNSVCAVRLAVQHTLLQSRARFVAQRATVAQHRQKALRLSASAALYRHGALARKEKATVAAAALERLSMPFCWPSESAVQGRDRHGEFASGVSANIERDGLLAYTDALLKLLCAEAAFEPHFLRGAARLPLLRMPVIGRERVARDVALYDLSVRETSTFVANGIAVHNCKSDPCGGRVTVYLLEKSRVINPGKDQRNFHFFYQFLSGASQEVAQYYQLYSAENFFYLNQSGCYTVPGVDDVKDYAEVLNGLNVLGFDQTEQNNLHAIIAGVLHLGNVAFHDNGKGGADVSYPEVLQLAATYFQVDPAALIKAICFRIINTGGGGGGGRRSTYNVPQNPEQAGGARDALSRDIYSKLFDWIVGKVNVALNKYQMQQANVIGILDIYGFEIFEDNSFEQFCINYVNEKLQQYFIELTLKAEQEEYQKEGIQWTPIPFFNNQVVVELIEGGKGKAPGIFSLLDDVCATVHAETGGKTDQKALEKIGGAHNSHPHFKMFSGAFGIKHYAGDVVYNINSFCDKNKDTLFPDIVETMQCSQNRFIVSLFPNQAAAAAGPAAGGPGQAQKKRPTTAGFKIKTSCNALMTELSKCTPHYVRCLAAGTPVALADGTARRIETLAPTEAAPLALASSAVAHDGAVVSLVESCTAAYDQGVRECVELTLEDGRAIVCTPDHRVRLASGQWARAEKLPVGEARVAVLAACTPLDEPAADEREWALAAGELRLSMAGEAPRARALAFARLLGATHAAPSAALLALDADVDVAKALCDAELVSAGDAALEGADVRVRGALLRALEAARDLAALEAAPLAFVREFCAALFGAHGAAPTLERGTLTGVALRATASLDDAALLARLLARCGVATSERLAVSDSAAFASRVGFRYCVEKEARLAAAVVALRAAPTRHEQCLAAIGTAAWWRADECADVRAHELPTLALLVVARRAVGACRVFDVSVPAQQAFFANGVAVHNCLKPNDAKKANNWNAPRVKHQCQYLGLLENVRVRRAGFAYRAPYARFLKRYMKLCPKTWSMGTMWQGDPRQGCIEILTHLRLDQTQYQCGQTKMFVRHPETVFFLEEQLERLDFMCVVLIQKAWRAYTQVKHALEMRAIASDLMKNKKERQHASQNRSYTGDYLNFENDFGVQQVFTQYSKEEILFYDMVKKVNRRGKQEDRYFVITDTAVYLIAKAIEKKQVFYKLMRRTTINLVTSISMSQLADNFFVLHVPSEYDGLYWNDKKTEIATILWEQYKAMTGKDLPVNFSNAFGYKLKQNKMAKIAFKKSEQAPPPGKCAGGGLGGGSITVQIASGLPSSTDTTPQGYVRGAKRAQGMGGGGGGGGGMMGGGGGRGGGGMMGGGGGGGGGMMGGGGGGAGRGGPAAGGARRMRAMYAYQGQTADELSFNEGDMLTVVQGDQGGWSECELNGRRGWCPSSYLQ